MKLKPKLSMPVKGKHVFSARVEKHTQQDSKQGTPAKVGVSDHEMLTNRNRVHTALGKSQSRSIQTTMSRREEHHVRDNKASQSSLNKLSNHQVNNFV